MFVDSSSGEIADHRQAVIKGVVSNQSVKLFLKRALDIVLGLSILILAGPIFILIACAIKLESRGPVFFCQLRNGKEGSLFKIYKFRSMQHNPTESFEQARENDPRITLIGKTIRKLSIDELPQLINVLRGDMSIVGPRPHAVEHDRIYQNELPGYMNRYKVKPGITGLAQIRGHRGPTPSIYVMKKRLTADLEYQEHWSLARDFNILLQTLPAVLTKTNAH